LLATWTRFLWLDLRNKGTRTATQNAAHGVDVRSGTLTDRPGFSTLSKLTVGSEQQPVRLNRSMQEVRLLSNDLYNKMRAMWLQLAPNSFNNVRSGLLIQNYWEVPGDLQSFAVADVSRFSEPPPDKNGSRLG
jgi:hypothetical protein